MIGVFTRVTVAIMSLFRACKQAPVVSQRAIPRALAGFCRYSSSESAVGTGNTKPSSDIVVPEQPPREVMVADVISGAPGTTTRFLH